MRTGAAIPSIQRLRAGLLTALLLATSCPCRAGDWPQWRGPERDGKVQGFTAPREWPRELPEEWKVEVGEGHSSPVVSGERVYLLVRRGEEEAALCLECRSGSEVWRRSYPAPYRPSPVAAAHGSGPKATPALGGGRLYTLGISGILSCFDLKSGEPLWKKDFQGRFPSTAPAYGTASSPLLEGGLLIAQVGGLEGGALLAFDAQSGEEKWSWGGDGPGYASPIAVDLAGERQVVTQSRTRFVGVAARTGKLLWEMPFKTPYDQNIVTPVRYRDLLIFSGLEQGTAALKLAGGPSGLRPEVVWRNQEVALYMSSPVLEGDLLFGFSHKKKGQLFCLDAAGGRTRWTGPGGLADNAAVVGAGPVLWVLTSGAELIFLEASPDGYRPLAQYKVAPSPTWAHPVLAGPRVLVKDRSTLRALTLPREKA